MYAAGALLPELVDGSHEVTPTAQAFYGAAATTVLDVIDGAVEQRFDGDMVVGSCTLSVDAHDGLLLPVAATDPLAPYGQQVVVRESLSAGGWVAQVPVGRYLIDNPAPKGRWAMHAQTAVRVGDSVDLQCPDLLTRLAESPMSGLVQPRPGATVSSEIRRLCSGLVPVDASTIPALSLTGRGMVYESDRLAALVSLARLVGRVLRMSRAGVLELVNPTRAATASWSVTVPAGRWIDAALAHSRDGIYNAVEAVGEGSGDDKPVVRGYARDTSASPYAATSPLGERLLRWSSPLLRNASQANTAAQTLLANRTAGREVTFTVDAAWNPAVDVLDTHQVTVVPATADADAVQVRALVVGLRWSLRGGPMQVTYTAPRDEVVAWTR